MKSKLLPRTYREENGIEHFYMDSVIVLQRFPTTGSCCRRVVRCVLFTIEIPLAAVWCLELCAGTLFLMLLKFGAILSIICGFLMAVSCWRHILQCIVIVQSFLRLLKLRKLAVCKLDFLRSYSVSRCVRQWIKLTPEYPFNKSLRDFHVLIYDIQYIS